jgi:hypothetical protein
MSMGVTRRTRNPYEQRVNGGGDMMAMSPGTDEDAERTIMGRVRRPPRPTHGRTMDLDTQEGVGLHSSHIDAMMRGEFRAGRGRGHSEGFEEAAQEWPVAYDNGWTTGAGEGEEFILGELGAPLQALIADVAAVRGGFKKAGDKKVTKAMLHEELTIIAQRLDTMFKQHVELHDNLTGA